MSNLCRREVCDCSAEETVLESDINTMEVDMTRTKTLAIGLLAVGVVLLLGSLLADILGVGATPLKFGYKQIAGSALGAVIAIIGAVLYWRAGKGN